MKEPESTLASLPDDIARVIASRLQEGELCALGGCSRFWRGLCGSDFLWESLTRQRWPSLDFSTKSSSVAHEDSSSLKGLRDFYMKLHDEMAERAMSVVQQVERCSVSDSLDSRDYIEAIELLNSMRLGFKDIKMFLFRPEVNVLLNLVGLHYCMCWLKVPAEHVMEALQNSKISQRQVCVKWWEPRFDAFQIKDESHSHSVSLQDLALPQENEVFDVLHQGGIYEILLVQISVFHSTCPSGLSQSTQVSD